MTNVLVLFHHHVISCGMHGTLRVLSQGKKSTHQSPQFMSNCPSFPGILHLHCPLNSLSPLTSRVNIHSSKCTHRWPTSNKSFTPSEPASSYKFFARKRGTFPSCTAVPYTLFPTLVFTGVASSTALPRQLTRYVLPMLLCPQLPTPLSCFVHTRLCTASLCIVQCR